jgi:ERCC4-related helicase
MAKSKINEKVVTEHKFTAEGTLNIDELQEGTVMIEVEEEGEVDLKKYLDKFNGKYIKISFSDKTEEIPEE